MRVKDQVVVVTGAAGGIGLGCAKRFAAEGAKVVLSDVDRDQGEAAAEALQAEGAEAVFVACDVGDKAAVEALVDSAVAAFGRLDCMVANAGIVKAGDFLEFTEEDFDAVPELLMAGFGQPSLVMELELHENRPLARADTIKVMQQLEEEGYFLQMPPNLRPDIYHGNED